MIQNGLTPKYKKKIKIGDDPKGMDTNHASYDEANYNLENAIDKINCINRTRTKLLLC